jgi:hypothetical protein
VQPELERRYDRGSEAIRARTSRSPAQDRMLDGYSIVLANVNVGRRTRSSEVRSIAQARTSMSGQDAASALTTRLMRPQYDKAANTSLAGGRGRAGCRHPGNPAECGDRPRPMQPTCSVSLGTPRSKRPARGTLVTMKSDHSLALNERLRQLNRSHPIHQTLDSSTKRVPGSSSTIKPASARSE